MTCEKCLSFWFLPFACQLQCRSGGRPDRCRGEQHRNSLFGDHKPYEEFFAKLKKAVADSDKETVASMIEYPFKVRISGKAVTIRDAAHFAADYDKVVTAKVRDAVTNIHIQTCLPIGKA